MQDLLKHLSPFLMFTVFIVLVTIMLNIIQYYVLASFLPWTLENWVLCFTQILFVKWANWQRHWTFSGRFSVHMATYKEIVIKWNILFSLIKYNYTHLKRETLITIVDVCNLTPRLLRMCCLLYTSRCV